MMQRRALFAAPMLAVPALARAQAWPSRPVRIVLAYPPGGSTDVLARTLAAALQEVIPGSSFVIDNRPGGAAVVGTQAVAQAAADGYTLALGNNQTHAANAAMLSSLPFDPVADFAPVSLVAMVPNMLIAGHHLPVQNVAELIAYGKANPGKLTYASSGVGTSIHLSGELFKKLTGVEMTHVPYRGSAPAIQDIMGGRVDVMFDNITSSLQQVRGGTLKGLAITTAKRSPFAPELPPVADTVPGYDVSSWFALFAPKKTPSDMVARMAADTKVALADASVKSRLDALAAESVGSTQAELAAFLAKESETWGRLIKDQGIRAE